MRVLLTGGSGFIGRFVLKELIETGTEVNVLVRDPSRLSDFNSKGINIFKGDIINIESVKRSVEGCTVIIHLAALVSSSVKDPGDYIKINLNGTENLLKAAFLSNVKKFVFTSSLSAYIFPEKEIIDEDSFIKPGKYFSPYAESKARAEELIIGAGNGISYIILYPTRVFGVGPLSDANAAGKAIYLYLQNKLPFLIDHGCQYANWAFVEDVANGIVTSALKNISNDRFILGGENKTLAEVYKTADNISNKKHLRINLKTKTALNLASIIELTSKLSGKQPFLTRSWLGFILKSCKYSCDKARSQLDYKITPFDRALEITVRGLNAL